MVLWRDENGLGWYPLQAPNQWWTSYARHLYTEHWKMALDRLRQTLQASCLVWQSWGSFLCFSILFLKGFEGAMDLKAGNSTSRVESKTPESVDCGLLATKQWTKFLKKNWYWISVSIGSFFHYDLKGFHHAVVFVTKPWTCFVVVTSFALFRRCFPWRITLTPFPFWSIVHMDFWFLLGHLLKVLPNE